MSAPFYRKPAPAKSGYEWPPKRTAPNVKVSREEPKPIEERFLVWSLTGELTDLWNLLRTGERGQQSRQCRLEARRLDRIHQRARYQQHDFTGSKRCPWAGRSAGRQVGRHQVSLSKLKLEILIPLSRFCVYNSLLIFLRVLDNATCMRGKVNFCLFSDPSSIQSMKCWRAKKTDCVCPSLSR